MTSFEFDRYEHTTVLCALIRYGLEVAHPEECIGLLEKLSPEPTVPWAQSITEARDKWRALEREAVRAELEAQEVAVMREP